MQSCLQGLLLKFRKLAGKTHDDTDINVARMAAEKLSVSYRCATKLTTGKLNAKEVLKFGYLFTRQERKEKVCANQHKPLLSPMSFLRPLLTKDNTVLVGKRGMFQEHKQPKK